MPKEQGFKKEDRMEEAFSDWLLTVVTPPSSCPLLFIHMAPALPLVSVLQPAPIQVQCFPAFSGSSKFQASLNLYHGHLTCLTLASGLSWPQGTNAGTLYAPRSPPGTTFLLGLPFILLSFHHSSSPKNSFPINSLHKKTHFWLCFKGIWSKPNAYYVIGPLLGTEKSIGQEAAQCDQHNKETLRRYKIAEGDERPHKHGQEVFLCEA